MLSRMTKDPVVVRKRLSKEVILSRDMKQCEGVCLVSNWDYAHRLVVTIIYAALKIAKYYTCASLPHIYPDM